MNSKDNVIDLESRSEAGAPDKKAALEEAFYSWWADNDHFLSSGSCGDVVALWEALGSAALANASTSLVSTSRAS